MQFAQICFGALCPRPSGRHIEGSLRTSIRESSKPPCGTSYASLMSSFESSTRRLTFLGLGLAMEVPWCACRRRQLRNLLVLRAKFATRRSSARSAPSRGIQLSRARWSIASLGGGSGAAPSPTRRSASAVVKALACSVVVGLLSSRSSSSSTWRVDTGVQRYQTTVHLSPVKGAASWNCVAPRNLTSL